MNYKIKLTALIICLLTVSVFAQNDKKVQDKNAKNKRVTVQDSKNIKSTKQSSTNLPSTGNEMDYKIISSNSSYIEIEFYPSFNQRQVVKYEGQSYDYITFKNGSDKTYAAGQPVIKCRTFPVFVPSDVNNTISVVSYDENDASGINLLPAPKYRVKDPSQHKYDFQNMIAVYEKDQKIYSQNKFFPENIAEITNPKNVRENLISNIVLYPMQYNPVTGVLKQYTRIRIRVKFGGNPVYFTRKRSAPEIELLRGAALNSDVALNWQNPKLILRSQSLSVTNSIMSTGDWYRIEIKDNGDNGSSEGIYKITKSFLQGANIDLSNIDPRTIKMYGNGGDMLSNSISDPRPNDLTEIPIIISNENTGHFGDNDYILFFAKSVNNWTYNSASRTFSHYLDMYSESNYYWICINTPNWGRRMPVISSENSQNAVTPSTFTEKLFFEPEVTNLINEGTLWLSDKKVNGESFVWNNTLTGLASNTNILYKIKPASRVYLAYQDYFLIKEDKSNMSEIQYPGGTIGYDWGDWIWTGTYSFLLNSSQMTNGEESSFRSSFYTSDPVGEGYLDWMEIQYTRRLNSVTGDFIRVVDTTRNAIVEFNVSSFSNDSIRVFNATVHDSVNIIQPISSSSSNVRFQRYQAGLSKYFVVGRNGYKTPTGISQKYPNQNLHGISDGYDFIIISYPDFIPAANRLKAKREGVGPNDPSYLKTLVVNVNQIYDEFSGGLLDAVAIRDFIKYAYDNWTRKPVFLCLLGDGSFDYKNIYGTNNNFIPAFEVTDPNINQVAGYAPDDFFVWIVGSDNAPDLAIGRIPTISLDQSNEYLDKIDCYEGSDHNGYWKDKIVYIADDGWTPQGGTEDNEFVVDCEGLANQKTPESIDPVKIYQVAYPAVITPGGRRKPSVNSDIIKFWNEGSIGLHYDGHGSPELWSNEFVFEKDNAISQLNNNCKYPFVTVASCDFGKFDNPLDPCGAELLVVTPNKGAIGTLAATRPTFGSSNFYFMMSFWGDLYNNIDTLLLRNRFGTAVFQTKQNNNEQNDLKFVLLCDPTVRTQIPRFRSRIDSISGLNYDTMQALSKIKVFGSVMHPDSSFWSDYNGNIFMKIFDVTRYIKIFDENGLEFDFTLPGGVIYAGNQFIKNGLWSIEFIVPKDISYQNQNGKLINYFYNSSSDGASVYKNFIVGGINKDAPVDTTGPLINLYLNDHNFRSGDVVNENFNLLADLYDESGINTTGTIGHKIEAIINNDNNNKIDLTQFYNSDTTYKSGNLTYEFSGMAPGHYTLKLRAWDTYNNSSEASIDFTVSISSALQVMNVYNVPNPFKDKTVFTFQHNYPNPITVRIKIYTVAGRLIKELDTYNVTDKFVAINWDGHDQDGDKLANGVYIYRLTVDAGSGNSVVSTGKLAVLR